MTENIKVHLNIQSRQFNTLKSLLIFAKISNFAFAFGAVVFGAFVSWALFLWGFFLLGVLSLGVFIHRASGRGAFVQGFPTAPRS